MIGTIFTTSRMRECAYRVLHAMIQGGGSSYSSSFMTVTTRLPSEMLNNVVDYLENKGGLIVSRGSNGHYVARALNFSEIEITATGRKLYKIMADHRALQLRVGAPQDPQEESTTDYALTE